MNTLRVVDLAGVGEIVRTARRAAGLSQKDLARLARISRATLNYLENEPDTDMGAIKLLAVLDVLGISLTLTGPTSDSDARVVDAALAAVPKRHRLSRAELVESFVTGRRPVGREEALAVTIDRLPTPALIAAVRIAAAAGDVAAKVAWRHAGELALRSGSTRTEWGKST